MTTTATTADGAAISLGDEQITELRGALRGALMLNDHAGYENAGTFGTATSTVARRSLSGAPASPTCSSR